MRQTQGQCKLHLNGSPLSVLQENIAHKEQPRKCFLKITLLCSVTQAFKRLLQPQSKPGYDSSWKIKMMHRTQCWFFKDAERKTIELQTHPSTFQRKSRKVGQFLTSL